MPDYEMPTQVSSVATSVNAKRGGFKSDFGMTDDNPVPKKVTGFSAIGANILSDRTSMPMNAPEHRPF